MDQGTLLPELPEVETVCRGLQPAMEGKRIIKLEQRRANLRFAFPKNFQMRVCNKKVVSLSRRAKFLLGDLEDGEALVIHLGMSGSFRIHPAAKARHKQDTLPSGFTGNAYHQQGRITAHDHVVFHMQDGTRIIYNDPRRFGFMLLISRPDLAQHKLFTHLGIEPLGNALTPDYLAARLKGKTTTLKAALLDQRIVAGLGNIYVAEALWHAQLSPKRKAGSLVENPQKTTTQPVRLINAIQDVLQEAIAAGGSSLRDHTSTDGSLGMFQHQFAVYDRAGLPCLRTKCHGTIEKFTQNGRSTFWCPICQN